MTSQQVLHADLLDILFENRNKDYGAYRLRRSYPAQLLKAIGGTALLVLALLFFGGPSAKQAITSSADDGYRLADVSLPTEVKPELPKPTTPPPTKTPVKQEVFLDKVKVVDKPITPIATQRSLDDALPGSERVDGPPAVGPQPPTPPAATGGLGTAEPEVEKKDPPLPSRQPQFPGGAAAWLRFLERYLMPPADLGAGEKRTVLVRFSVDEEGTVTNFVVVQSGGDDFDKEVIRALKKMPRWLPAIQNGKPTAVSFTQPVTFVGTE